jgi:hypothetical protein
MDKISEEGRRQYNTNSNIEKYTSVIFMTDSEGVITAPVHPC